ncbi:hypothetical protein MHBO_003191 [Bonamia ostreae]|uniref:C3H1-type domain-containing protein n=1 Tax=Bonamia ostreae TaxID=126728 RepID=A0ABV2APQ0_9EUKA
MPKKKKNAQKKGKEKTPKMPEKPKIDKTFGMKNKKGKKAATFIKNIKGSQNNSQQYKEEQERKREIDRQKSREQERLKKIELEKKEAEQKAAQELIEKEAKKKILCSLFVKGDCRSGAECDYLHDWSKIDKTEKIDPYTDPRIDTQFYPSDKAMMCRHFLESLKQKKYGFFWVCPNKGQKCQYKHFLPRGYMLPSDKKASMDDGGDRETIEDIVDMQRNELLETMVEPTKITLSVLLEWQKDNAKSDLTSRRKKLENEKKSELSGKEYFLDDKNRVDESIDDFVDLEKSVKNKSLFLDESLVSELDKLDF